MVTVPAELREKYGIKEGSKVSFVDQNGVILFIPLKSFSELWGAEEKNADLLREAALDLEEEHRREARG